MLYTPSHAELAQHPKTRKLARLLGVSIPTALGHLHLLWHFALKYAPDGDISRFDNAEIADGCLWEGEPDALVGSLCAAAWIDQSDEGDTIHDWDEHGGKLVRRQEANATRMRESRAKQPPSTEVPRATHVQRTNAARVEPEESREEEKRVEETRGERGGPIPPPPRPINEPPKRATARPTLPSADQLIADLREWADEKGVRDILADEVDRFRDYCLSGKNGKPVTYADYAAACRKWITNPNYGHGARAPALTGPNGHHPTQPKRTANNIEVLRRAF